MILVLIVFVFFYLLLLSECTVTTSKETKDAIAKLSAREKEDFDNSFFWMRVFDTNFMTMPHLRVALLETALNEHFKGQREEMMRSRYHFSVLGLIDYDFGDVLSIYLKPEYKLDFNYYFERAFIFDLDRASNFVYDGNHSRINHKFFTPLQLAVAQNKLDLVRRMVDASLSPKLKLDMPHLTMRHVNARSIARKLYSPYERRAMLEVLKIDKEKHDLTLVKRHLKDDLEITVKEAVLADDVDMVESALLLGNFGDKTDVNIIRWAMKNENYLIVEMLVMEDYSIPAKSNRPYFNRMDRDDIDFILDKGGLRRPLPKRYNIYPQPYNAHCF